MENNNNNNEIILPTIMPIIPLEFWFTKNPGLALPLMALGRSRPTNIPMEFYTITYSYSKRRKLKRKLRNKTKIYIEWGQPAPLCPL